jgi:hypothetical protein
VSVVASGCSGQGGNHGRLRNLTAGSCDAHLPFGGSDLSAGLCAKAAVGGGVCQFLHWQKGFGIPSSAAFGKIGDAYVAEVFRWAKANTVYLR